MQRSPYGSLQVFHCDLTPSIHLGLISRCIGVKNGAGLAPAFQRLRFELSAQITVQLGHYIPVGSQPHVHVGDGLGDLLL